MLGTLEEKLDGVEAVVGIFVCLVIVVEPTMRCQRVIYRREELGRVAST